MATTEPSDDTSLTEPDPAAGPTADPAGDESGQERAKAEDVVENARVFCRVRPPWSGPHTRVVQSSLECLDETSVRWSAPEGQERAGPGSAQRVFNYTRVLPPNLSQEEVFAEVGQPLVESVLEGKHAAILAYGQTVSNTLKWGVEIALWITFGVPSYLWVTTYA